MEEYAAVLENRIDYGKGITKEEAEADESEDVDIDFVGKTSLKEELAGLDRKIGELDSLN